jgi:hypothetical protein
MRRRKGHEAGEGIPDFKRQTIGKIVILLGRRDVYGFLFSVRRDFI